MDPKTAALIDAWHWNYVDFDLVFQELAPHNLYRRPDPGSLSLCEHVAHLMRSEASIISRYLFAKAEETWADHWMLQPPFGWPPDILAGPVDARFEEFDVEEIRTMAWERHNKLVEDARSLDLPLTFTFADEWAGPAPTVEVRLRYAAYHVGYHVGQMYQTRHLLGETTPDN